MPLMELEGERLNAGLYLLLPGLTVLLVILGGSGFPVRCRATILAALAVFLARYLWVRYARGRVWRPALCGADFLGAALLVWGSLPVQPQSYQFFYVPAFSCLTRAGPRGKVLAVAAATLVYMVTAQLAGTGLGRQFWLGALMITVVSGMAGLYLHYLHRKYRTKEYLLRDLAAGYRELQSYSHHLEEIALRDPLTNLYNYRYFVQRLDYELQHARAAGHPVSLVVADLDYFKKFNDTYGHPAGDRILQSVAAVFQANVRQRDVVARYGGEEFLLLLPGADIVDAVACAERIRTQIQNVFRPYGLTISAGVACFPTHAATGEELLELADRNLYQAKYGGRNRVEAAK